ncbi:hypothetical protein [Pseudostreptobacillus hongkongensis]|uniref:hypothetical protein n=1 Tax=Pseudostreptobacillus hongkongensis TaxID=1162717 RepID=UPI00082E2741|nr:hypothetical protein [Pseudostreptobacillus hongkongensis]
MLNKNKILALIIENGLSRESVAKELDISYISFNRKLNSNSFKKTELEFLKNLLKVDNTDIFFENDLPCKGKNMSPITLNPQEDEMTDQEAMDYLFGRKKG